MGRSSSLKTNEAVRVPKDGPILWHLENESAPSNVAVGTKQSLELLSTAKSDEGWSEALGSSRSQNLWKILVGSEQLRPQLQALQAYRSKLIQAKDGADVTDQNELIGTYRLLLEWSLSDNIPTPLRRAILSNLETLNSIIGREDFRIREEAIESLLKDGRQQECWSNPLRSLFEMLNYEPTRAIIVQDGDMSVKTLELLVKEAEALQPVLDEDSFFNQDQADQPQSITSRTTVTVMETSAFIGNTLKLLLAPLLSSPMTETALCLAPLVDTMQCFLWSALTCRGIPSDELNVIGVVYGQALLFDWKVTTMESDSSSSLIAGKAVEKVQSVTTDPLLPHQNKLAAVQGITASLPNEVLLSRSPPVFSDPIAEYLLGQCRTATSSTVRLSALRALHTLINRCLAIQSAGLLEDCHQSYINELADGTLEVVLQAWDCPPARQVATAVPGLFRSLIVLLRNNDSTNGASSSTLKKLVKRILSLPSSQKGKYLALEALLPAVGAKYMIDIANEDFIDTLIAEIGKRGQNAVAITDFLGELLSRLREEMSEEAGLVVDTEKQKPKRKITQDEDVACELSRPERELPFLPTWVALWAPPLARALISGGSASERKNISSRSIPLLITIVGGQACRDDASYAFCFLLDEVRAQRGHSSATQEQVESYASETETHSDRILWATFEIARQLSLQKLMKLSYPPQHLVSAISSGITREVLESSLTHSSQSIRLAAYAAIQAVVPTYSFDASPLQLLEREVAHWRLGLPYATKCGGREFNKELLTLLTSLINRLSVAESLFYSKPPSDSKMEQVETLPILTSFVRDFLLAEVVLQQGAYPGTVADKEEMALSLFQCILNFVTQDGFGSQSTQSRVKSGNHRRQSPRAIEVATMRHILLELVSNESISALLSLLHSMWDGTRAKAFTFICHLVEEAHVRDIQVPARFTSPENIRYIQARSTYLASSPRQREADTGSKMLAFLGALHKTEDERQRQNENILTVLSERLDIMANILGVVSSNSSESSMATREDLLGDGARMPMAHGLMMAIRLTIENNSIHLGRNDDFYGRFIMICCTALQHSLAIVADLKDDSSTQEFYSMSTSTQLDSTSTPLNVNTGAIGANAGFSSIQGVCENETLRRFAFQRIIMGSWLMTKEACASIASTVTYKEFEPSVRLVESVGNLLISTLTTLKHQGAAFAAHRALQEIVEFCFTTSLNESFVNLPLVWAKRLVRDISGEDNVRDSTLRRSTGYALGFLSIMRSEPPSSVTPRTLCPDMLGTLVRLSLPPEEELDRYMKLLRLNSNPEASLYSRSTTISSQFNLSLQVESNDQERTRVHALNILRLAILDAPLAPDTRPFISDAIISSLIGYEDSRWAVRNSSTMVYAAALLRVVDADKNASSSSGNAITATELFRRYPMLRQFLLQVMEKGVGTMLLENRDEASRLTYPSLYPVLLLLARLQPVAISGEASVDLMEPFIPTILQCLKHRQHKIRLVAARALSNVSSNEASRQSFIETLLCNCKDMLSFPEYQQPDWNAAHGALLGIQHLLLKMPEPGLMLAQNELGKRLHSFVGSATTNFRCPPPCSSVALEILTNVAKSKRDGGLDLRGEIMRMSITVISELKRKGCNSIGESRLGAIASRGFCECCVGEAWEPTTNPSKRESSLKSLSFLLENDIIDVRLEASKVFKKSICSKIDGLLTRSDVTQDAQKQVVLEVARTLQKALTTELHRNHMSTSNEAYSIGMHPPTVRRLSRCLLECHHALRALGFVFEVNTATAGVISARTTWETSLIILELKEDSVEIVTLLDTNRLLNGNAVELMAFAIQAWILAGDTSIDAKLRFFVEVLTLINDEAPWRLRHSVAVAVETSQILLLDVAYDDILTIQRKLIAGLFALLQDSDPDVRFVAGRAIRQAVSREKSSTKPSSSQLMIETGYMSIPEWFPGGEMNARLLESLVASCRGVVDNIDCFELEMAQSENESPLQLMNLGTERKIFEDEVANSFEEMLLANHLRVAAVVKSSAPILPEDGEQQELFDLCCEVVKRILARERRNQNRKRSLDVAHEVTRSNLIFPYIHSLIIGSTASIYIGANDSTDVRGEAQRLLSLLGTDRKTAIHPCISQALGVLASACQGNKQTRQSLLHCCFLVPYHS